MDNGQVVLVISSDDEDEANKIKKCTEEEAARDGGSGSVQAEVDVIKKRMKNKRRKKQKNMNMINNQQSLENISDDDVKIGEQSDTLKAVVGTSKVLEDDAAKKGEQIDIVKAVESTNNVETNSVLKSKNDVAEMLVHAATVKMLKAQADTLEDVETAKAIKVGESVRSIDVIDLISSSSDEDKVIADVRSSEGVEGTLPLKPIVDVVKVGSQPNTVEPGRLEKELANESVPITEHNTPQQIFKEKHVDTGEDSETVKSYGTNSVEKKNNIVLQKLLRGPRYFDPQGTNLEMLCFHCGKEGHKAFQCIAKRRNKPCFVCGVFGHGGMSCKQGLECFFCKRTGHFARNCPDKTEEIHSISNICLRCGELEHDMWTCNGDYPNDDLKDIQCYICKNFGHLCCVDYPNLGSKQVSCYNCGQPGHVGSECAKLDRKVGSRSSTAICRKCGERGHLTRKCKKIYAKAAKKADLLAQRDPNEEREKIHAKAAKKADLLAQRDPNEEREISGSKSAPPDFNKARGKRKAQYDERESAAAFRPRGAGMWNAQGGEVLVYRDLGPNVWRAPSTSTRNNQEMPALTAPANFVSPQNPVQMFNHPATPSSQAYQPRFAPPRLGNQEMPALTAYGNVLRPQTPSQTFSYPAAQVSSATNNQELSNLSAFNNMASPQNPALMFNRPVGLRPFANNNQGRFALSASGNFSTPQNSSHMFNHPPTPGSSFQNNQGKFALSAPGNFSTPQNSSHTFNRPPTPGSSFQNNQGMFALSAPGNFSTPQNSSHTFNRPPTPGSSFQNNRGMPALTPPNNFVNPQNPVQMFNHPATPSSQAYQPRFAPPRFGNHGYGGVNQIRHF